MSVLMIRCPYGHDGEAIQVEIKTPRYGREYLAALQGIKCGECGRIFVREVHHYPIWGGIDHILVSHHIREELYEQDGSWEGQSIQLWMESSY